MPQHLFLLTVWKDQPQSFCSDLNPSTLCLGIGISVDPNEIKQRCVIDFLFSLYKKYAAYLLVPLRAELGCRLNCSYLQSYTPRASSVLKVDVRIYFYHMSPSLLELTLTFPDVSCFLCVCLVQLTVVEWTQRHETAALKTLDYMAQYFCFCEHPYYTQLHITISTFEKMG